MAGEHAPAGRELGAHRLGDAEDDPADERAPQRAEPADDHRLEREDQPVGPLLGANVVRMPRNSPAMATMASGIAMARA